MPVDRRLLRRVNPRAALTLALSNPRARGKQPPGRRLFCLRNLRPALAGGGGVAAELWGRVGASGLASARVGYASPLVAATFPFAPGYAWNTSVTPIEHVARIGLNYKFDWGPVVAKY